MNKTCRWKKLEIDGDHEGYEPLYDTYITQCVETASLKPNERIPDNCIYCGNNTKRIGANENLFEEKS